MDMKEKTRENRLRRKLERMGYRLTKSRRRDPRAYDFGGYMILDAWNNNEIAGGHPYGYSMNIDDVENFTKEEGPNKRK